MIRIDRQTLDECVDAFRRCAARATTVDGLRIVFPVEERAAEAAVLGALSILSPSGPATADDMVFVSKAGHWPRRKVLMTPEQRAKL